MSDQWFYGEEGQQRGPVPLEALRARMAAGQTRDDDLVWREGMPNWAPAASVPELAGAAPARVGAVPITPDMQADYAPAGQPGGALGYYSHLAVERPRYAGFWIRFLAVIIDAIALAVILVPLQIVARLILGDAADDLGAFLGLNAIQYAIYAAYFGLMESSSRQATLGKMACGLFVTDLSGARISPARAVGRYFASLLSAMILSIGYIMGAFTERKQTLHDLIVGTVVLKR